MKRILIVEDDVSIGNLLEEALTGAGYAVTRAYSGTEAVFAYDAKPPDLALLDLALPGLSGEEVLPKLAGIPVLVVSARADTESKAGLLLTGAADYITKPFEVKELLARVAVALRGAAQTNAPVLRFAGLELDAGQRLVLFAGKSARLTRTEAAVLGLLMQNPSNVLPKSRMLDRLADDAPDCTEASLKTHMSNLRRKLRGISGHEYIEAVWGIGFMLRAPLRNPDETL